LRGPPEPHLKGRGVGGDEMRRDERGEGRERIGVSALLPSFVKSWIRPCVTECPLE